MAYVDYFRCKRVYTEKNNKNSTYVLWSEGYCDGNVIEVRYKTPDIMERGKLYEVIYGYSSSCSFCTAYEVKEIKELPAHVYDMGCEYPYQKTVVSFIQRTPSSKDKLFDVYFTIKDKEQNRSILFHTNWNGKNKRVVEKEMKTNFLTLNMGYPWNIIVCRSGKSIPSELFKSIQDNIDNGTYNEWEAIEF